MDSADIGKLLELFEERLQKKLDEFKEDVKDGLNSCGIEIKNMIKELQDLNFKILNLHQQIISLQKNQYVSEKETNKEIDKIWSEIKKLKKEKNKWKQ